MVVIYAAQSSPRLQYITSFIFNDLLQTAFQITNDLQAFEASYTVKLSYHQHYGRSLRIVPGTNLLFEEDIKPLQIIVEKYEGFKVLFSTQTKETNVFPFDIFAASFYLLSRYEEYLPNDKDEYGRYYYKQSLAFRHGFLKEPLINIWVKYFAEWLQQHQSSFQYKLLAFKFISTYDVDIAYAYKGKGFLRNILHLSKSIFSAKLNLFKQQLNVLYGNTNDPFDHFHHLMKLDKKYYLRSTFFLLTIFNRSKYDKNIPVSHPLIKSLFKQLSTSNTTGIHPSYKSGDDVNLLFKEKKSLEEVIQKKVNISRYHYLRFTLPQGYQRLIAAGFNDDYSMGYGQVNGFRASVASSFYWYDLQNDAATILRVHPFCFMDSTSIFHLRHEPTLAFAELQQLYDSCMKAGGECITIFHNHLMAKPYQNWKTGYESFLKENCI